MTVVERLWFYVFRGCIGTISVLARLKVHGQISAVGRGPTKGSACRLRSSFVPENSGCCCAGIASIQPLRKRHLQRYRVDVTRFFAEISTRKFQSEIAQKYQRRFVKYEE